VGRYQGRHHTSRHAAVPTSSRSLAPLRRPAVAAPILAATLAAGSVAAEATQSNAETAPKVVLTSAQSAAGQAESALFIADEARIATDRSGVNTQRALLDGKVQEAARVKAAALEKARRAAQEQAARAAQRKAIINNAINDPVAAAKVLMPDYGFSGDAEHMCLYKLWYGESGWKYTATNPTSGAYGIPQALPASKMASAGADWQTNPLTQIKWGLEYIKQSYGTPCNAFFTWLNRLPHWY
jgi:hypothetical protein